jgi:hypothetical protein
MMGKFKRKGVLRLVIHEQSLRCSASVTVRVLQVHMPDNKADGK